MSTSVAVGRDAVTDVERTYLAGGWRTVEHEASYRLPTFATVELSAGLLEELPGVYGRRGLALPMVARRWTLTVSPGSLRLRSRGPVGREGVDNGEVLAMDTAGWQAVKRDDVPQPEAGRLFYADGERTRVRYEPMVEVQPALIVGVHRRGGAKQAVTGWSRKSRLNMARVLSSLDWAGHIEAAPAGWRPQMLTLTLPGEWESLVPTGQDFKRLFRAWLERWYREFGRRWAGCWKLEFQGRGAPHLHLYGNAPTGLAFKRWLSESWYEVVDSGDERHLHAGTGVDWKEGVRGTDPRSIALYFLGKSVGHNLGLGKEYQHRVPELWQGPGAGPGRFWGHRGLERCEATVELDGVMFVRLRREVRRWAKGQGQRCCVNYGRRVRGEGSTWRSVCRCARPGVRGRRRVRAAGWGRWQGYTLLHGDAPAWVAQLARWDGLAAGDRAPKGVDPATGEVLARGPWGVLP